jgi:hypothetical protein
MAIGRVSLQRVSRGGSPGLHMHITHYLLQKGTSNFITRLPLPDFNKIDIQRGQEAESYRRLHRMSRYVQHKDCKYLMPKQVSETIMHQNTISRHGNLSLDCIAWFCTSPIQYMHLLGSLALPTSHKLWFTCGLRSRTHQPHKSTSET